MRLSLFAACVILIYVSKDRSYYDGLARQAQHLIDRGATLEDAARQVGCAVSTLQRHGVRGGASAGQEDATGAGVPSLAEALRLPAQHMAGSELPPGVKLGLGLRTPEEKQRDLERAKELVDQARQFLAIQYPYYQQVLYMLNWVWDAPGVPTLAVDNEGRLFVNSGFVALEEVTGSDKEGENPTLKTMSLLMHEVNHLLRYYFERMGSRKMKAWNYAHDMEINSDLKKIGALLPDKSLLPEHRGLPDGETGEYYYQQLKDQHEEKKQQQKGQPQQGQGGGPDDPFDDPFDEPESCPACDQGQDGQDGQDGQGDQDGQGGGGQGDQDGQGGGGQGDQDGQGGGGQGDQDGQGGGGQGDQQGQGGGGQGDQPEHTCGGDHQRCGREALDNMDPRDLKQAASDQGVEPMSESQVEELIRETAAEIIKEAEKGRGNVPEGLLRNAKDILRPKANWKQLLRSRVSTATQRATRGLRRKTYTRIDGRHGPVVPGQAKVLRPGIVQRAPTVSIVTDTSGSMSRDDLDRVLSECRGIIDQGLRGSKVNVLACDAAAGTVQRVKSAREIDLTGGGGTDMGVGMLAAVEQTDPDVLIVLTDGETPWPKQKPKRQMEVVIGIIHTPGVDDGYLKQLKDAVPKYATPVLIPTE